ncbi:MAG TPA: DUF438 domain-containing protein [Candidatus Acidoferrales bacterium]|nr:DUF438 domain-containing protein [Candidatus Acidoferrales bacterium]
MSELIDKRAHRIENLKHIISHLHAGHSLEQVKQEMSAIVRQTDAGEIMAMEQQLINEGMPVEAIQSMCDLHSQVTRGVLVQISPRRETAPGDPVDTFQRENKALGAVAATANKLLGELRSLQAGQDATAIVFQLRQAINDLMDVDKHYQRKEHALFSCLERHGISGPAKVMWAKDDEIRSLLKTSAAELAHTVNLEQQREEILAAVERAVAALEEMIYKEENILLPMSLETLTEEEWAEVWMVSPKYGWCLVEPRTGYEPPAGVKSEALDLPKSGVVMLPSGNVTLQQLSAIFSTLPLDLTFVDADDRVAFFTEGPERIFARSKAVIGRKVQNCHPPRSVGTVNEILRDFRSRKRDVAEFWINFQGKFVHIRYFAVRDQQGNYLGTLELTQDLAPLRKLEGERRLLQYE